MVIHSEQSKQSELFTANINKPRKCFTLLVRDNWWRNTKELGQSSHNAPTDKPIIIKQSKFYVLANSINIRINEYLHQYKKGNEGRCPFHSILFYGYTKLSQTVMMMRKMEIRQNGQKWSLPTIKYCLSKNRILCVGRQYKHTGS